MAGTVFVALLAGHLLGDWVAQTDEQAAHKTHSWEHMAEHVVVYHIIVAAFLALIGLHWRPALAILAVSAITHAFIDRRWPVKRLLKATGSEWFSEQTWGVLAADQALHLSILAICALVVG